MVRIEFFLWTSMRDNAGHNATQTQLKLSLQIKWTYTTDYSKLHAPGRRGQNSQFEQAGRKAGLPDQGGKDIKQEPGKRVIGSQWDMTLRNVDLCSGSRKLWLCDYVIITMSLLDPSLYIPFPLLCPAIPPNLISNQFARLSTPTTPPIPSVIPGGKLVEDIQVNPTAVVSYMPTSCKGSMALLCN